MGTKSATTFIDQNGDVIFCLHRTCDGDAESHGVELAHSCKRTLVRGVGNSEIQEPETHANGIEELALLVAIDFKLTQSCEDGLGGFYAAAPPKKENPMMPDVDFNYLVKQVNIEEDTVVIEAYEGGSLFFQGTPDEFLGRFGER